MIESIPYKHNPKPEKDAKLVKAAIWVDSLVYTGWRHAEIMLHLRMYNLTKHVSQDMQGFIDQYGNFYRRKSAGTLAYINGQTKKYHSGLLSEYLWDEDGTPCYDPMAG